MLNNVVFLSFKLFNYWQLRRNILECGPRGPGRPWRSLSSDRMQSLVEFRGSSFLRNTDSELKIQEYRPNLSIFLGSESWCAGLEIVDKTHKDGFYFVEVLRSCSYACQK